MLAHTGPKAGFGRVLLSVIAAALLAALCACEDKSGRTRPAPTGQRGTGGDASSAAATPGGGAAGVEALQKAMGDRDWDAAKRLVRANSSLANAHVADGQSALWHVLHLGDGDMALFLLEYGADVKPTGRRGETMLHEAAGRNMEPVVTALLRKGAAVDARGPGGQTALFLAGDVPTVQALLRFVPEVQAVDDHGSPVLHHHARLKHPEIVRLLLQKGAKAAALDREGKTPLFYVTMDDAATIEALIDAALDVKAAEPKQQRTALHEMAASTYDPTSPEKGLGLLVAAGASMEAKDKLGQAPAHLALATGKTLLAREMFARGASADLKTGDGRSYLHCAAQGGSLEMVKMMLAKGNAINAQDDAGETALFRAARGGHQPVVQHLLDQEADANLRNKAGATVAKVLSGMTDPRSHEIARVIKEKGGTE